jgi:hypothetical protein
MAKIIDYHLVCMIPRERVLVRLVRPPRTRVRKPFATANDKLEGSGPNTTVVAVRRPWSWGAAVARRAGVPAARQDSAVVLGRPGLGGRVTERLCVATTSLTQHLLQ